MLKNLQTLRIIESPALILLYLSLPFQSFSQKVHAGPSKAPGSSLAPSWSWWERRRWDASIWNSVVHQTLQSRMVGVRRQPQARDFYRSLCSWLLCVIVPFIYGFLWHWGHGYEYHGCTYECYELKAEEMLLVRLWIFDSSLQIFVSFLWLGFVPVPSRACSLLVWWLRTQAFECETVVACYGLRVLLFLAFICDSLEFRTEAATQNLKKAIFTSTVKR